MILLLGRPASITAGVGAALTLLLTTGLHGVSAGGNRSHPEATECKDGIVLPVWMPKDNLSTGDVVARGLVYFLAMIYMFVGVSIIADRFMASIEVITSKEKEVIIKKPNGETQKISVRIWNETVSNLTLMALGSSAPEILLSIIEVYGHNFEAGQLGPSTIVGSAAFNMFVIVAICVWSIPSNENRRIKHLRVFFVTMTWSVFAYIWLYLILTLSSEGIITVWEGLATFSFFPATVLTAYIADRRLLIYKFLPKKYHKNKRGVIVGGEGDDMELGTAMAAKANHVPDGGVKIMDGEEGTDEMREFEEHRQQYVQILRELRRRHPNCSMEELEMMARDEIMNKGPKSRAFYRIQATRKLMGGGNIIKRKADRGQEVRSEEEKKPEGEPDDSTKVFFDPAHYTVMENVGQFSVTVSREGDLSQVVCVDYKTEDGSANAGSDYEGAEGTLLFRPGEAHKQILLTVIDDDVFEEDEHFYVHLNNPRFLNADGMIPRANGPPTPIPPAAGASAGSPRPGIVLFHPYVATVMILDDDHSGVFGFAEPEHEVSESAGEYRLGVSRYSGARGRVVLPFRTVDGTAKAGAEFEGIQGEMIFENNETSKFLPLHIVDNESYDKDAIFYVELGDPILEEDLLKEQAAPGGERSPSSEMSEAEKVALLGKPRLGENYKCQVRIKESKEFRNTVDKLFQKANTSLMVGTSSWKEQFIEAITVSAGDDDEGEDGEGGGEKMPACSDYVLHFFTIFWKVLFAFVPPTDMWGGWACFLTSIFMIGLLTAVVGDLASHFGCSVGLLDSVTAISFVALGTSIPDTFASKVAAMNDEYADSSIGNVTGSNAVNVFLGIGVAWTIAAVYHYYNNTVFRVDAGSLAFSVTIFCVCAAFGACVLMCRRHPKVGGELGGPMKYKLPTTILFVGLWALYVLLSSLEAYGYIEGF